MLRTVHGVYLATIAIILYCDLINCIQINQEDVQNIDLQSLQVVEPLKTNKNNVEIIPEDDVDILFTTIEEKWNQNGKLKKDTIIEGQDKQIKQRKTRQATHGHSQLYPQLPSGPPYNPYQTEPGYNSPGQNSYQPQHSYTPPGQNLYQPQPSYAPPGQNPYQPQRSYAPFGQNPNVYNSSQPGNPSHNYYPNTGSQGSYQGKYNTSQPGSHNPNTGSFNPYTSQNPYGPHRSSPHYNSTTPGNPYRPSAGQYPSYNQSSNYPYNTASFRPPNATGHSFSTPYPPFNPRPGLSVNNNSYPGQPPYNNFYSPTTGNTHPVINLNSSSQRPPYYNPYQYPSNSHPNQPRWPNSNSSYPNFQGGPFNMHNMSNGKYPHSSSSPYLPQPPQNSPFYPGTRSQYPNNTYPTSNSSAGFADTYYNPSMPNYPPHNYNQGQNNYYSQRENTEYDPRRVPPQNFSYH